ncbi:diphthine--ammonia ligase [Flavobacterium sp. DG1-102-2]|uniref:Dph6-related ATP pyrophosphatase n=1 Tax=Flavobacterium sp. DG1-102-2 TaxID=3081663 RepID=UPI002949B36F|nr:diphthine--ammonia ligase [Flavobacterium sp. DG1-102-2]MDV6166920.1 diphthine--ammonia ligase [Flavobacterium sp. DG1-102-2]
MKTYFNWSTGKDSALALYYLLQDKNYSVDCLFTSVNSHYNRVSMHGLRRELLEQQIAAMGIPLITVELPEQPTNAEYESLLKEKVNELLKQDYECAAFGDIFLEDLKAYREKQLEPFGIKTVFPLWKKDTRQLLTKFINLGFKAITVCVDGSKLDSSFVGRIIDESFIADLPEGVDICGENGEFHTFCYDGPYFKHPVNFTKGEIVLREYDTTGFKSQYWFCDLLPK